jgi:hypothetical protein
MPRVAHNLIGKTREERRAYRDDNRRALDAFIAEDAALLDSGEFLGGVYRPSDSTPALPGPEMAALDGLLERHGLARVLRTLRELCDGRAPNGDLGDSFEVEEDKDQWREKGDALESLLATLAQVKR